MAVYLLRREKKNWRNRLGNEVEALIDAEGNDLVYVGEKRVISFYLRSDLLRQLGHVPGIGTRGAQVWLHGTGWRTLTRDEFDDSLERSMEKGQQLGLSSLHAPPLGSAGDKTPPSHDVCT